MIPELGLFSLILAFGSAITLAFVSPIGLIAPRFHFLQSLSKPAAFAQLFFVLISFGTLMLSFMQDDFSVNYIAQNSNTNLPFMYKLCALWGAHEGSLLLWAFILTIWTAMVALWSKRLPQKMNVMVLAIMGALSFGFLFLLLQTSNPFERVLPFAQSEGSDLNPLLQDPGFIIHPPFLYMGYVGFAIPFAFALSYMILRKPEWPWALWARPWALLAWAFLTVGITLGSWWAYYELGWGGWWFWDPVENASFMPWLVGVALGHALLMTTKNHTYNAWSLILALSAFILSLMGTFLVRSGVLSSVHAFASDPLRGAFILVFLGIVLLLSTGLYLGHKRAQMPTLPTVVSKESVVLLGNVILLSATFTVLLGTLYPLIIEVLQGEKISVGPPYFNVVFVPMMLPILLLAVFATQLNWGQDTFKQLWQKTNKLLFAFAIVMVMALYFLRSFPVLAWLGVLLGAWVILGTLYKLAFGIKQVSFNNAGMILGHLGLGVAVLGMALTSTLSTEKEFTLVTGETVAVNSYQFTFETLKDIEGPNFKGIQGHFVIKEGDKIRADLYPEKRYFIPRNLPMTETAIAPGLLKDFYIALGERLDDGSWTVRIYIKPFVRCIWLGGLIIALGALCASLVAFRRAALTSREFR